jgi:heme oxygenase
MKLHTREQAPKEGRVEAPKRNKPWAPTLKGYLQFLAESKVVYETFEDVLKDERHPEYVKFQNTGLERSQALSDDIAWYTQQFDLPQPVITDSGPGMQYAKHLREIAADDPQDFVCHFYNYYFAHTAGGRMIGKNLANSLLAGKELKFYQYDGDVNQLLDTVRANLNDLAESWTREQKDHCLQETADAFKWSGKVMACMTEAEE